MDRKQTVRELLDEYDRGLTTRMEVLNKIIDVLVNADVDAQLAEISPHALDWVLWGLRDQYAPIIGHDPDAYSILEGVTVRRGEEEEYRLDLARREERLRTIEIPSIQRWLRAHPLPTRELFPIAVVRGAHARIERDRKALWATMPPHLTQKEQKAWSKRERYDELCSVEIGLYQALERAELAGAGSQEQALAWDGFERVAHLLALREDLTAEERELVINAQRRRRERVGSLQP